MLSHSLQNLRLEVVKRGFKFRVNWSTQQLQRISVEELLSLASLGFRVAANLVERIDVMHCQWASLLTTTFLRTRLEISLNLGYEKCAHHWRTDWSTLNAVWIQMPPTLNTIISLKQCIVKARRTLEHLQVHTIKVVHDQVLQPTIWHLQDGTLSNCHVEGT